MSRFACVLTVAVALVASASAFLSGPQCGMLATAAKMRRAADAHALRAGLPPIPPRNVRRTGGGGGGGGSEGDDDDDEEEYYESYAGDGDPQVMVRERCSRAFFSPPPRSASGERPRPARAPSKNATPAGARVRPAPAASAALALRRRRRRLATRRRLKPPDLRARAALARDRAPAARRALTPRPHRVGHGGALPGGGGHLQRVG